MMTEESLNNLTLEELLDLMANRTAELLEARKTDIDYKVIALKKEEVDVLQKVILSKRAGRQLTKQ